MRGGKLELVSYTFVFKDYDEATSAEFDNWVIPREFLLRWNEEKYREVLAYNVAGKGIGAPVEGPGSKDVVTDGSGGLRTGVPRPEERKDSQLKRLVAQAKVLMNLQMVANPKRTGLSNLRATRKKMNLR